MERPQASLHGRNSEEIDSKKKDRKSIHLKFRLMSEEDRKEPIPAEACGLTCEGMPSEIDRNAHLNRSENAQSRQPWRSPSASTTKVTTGGEPPLAKSFSFCYSFSWSDAPLKRASVR